MRQPPLATLLAPLLALALGGVARAQDAPPPPPPADPAGAPLPVTVQASFGFGRNVVARGFAPLQVELVGGEAYPELSVRLRSVDDDTTLFELGTVALEAGVSRRVAGTVAVDLLREAGPLLVTCETPGGERVGQVEVAPEVTQARVLLVLDRRGAPPTDLSLLEASGERAGRAWTVLPVSRLEAVPSTPLAYAGVRAVLLGDLELERWTPTQAAALAGWVTRGGHLVLSLGARAAVLKRAQLGRALGAALAPVPFEGAPLGGDGVRLAGLLGTYGELPANAPPSPPFLTRLHPGPEDLVLHTDDAEPAGRPVVVRRHHGRGRVDLVGCDLWAPPFVHARPTAGLLQALLEGAGAVAPRTDHLFQELREIRQPAQVGGAFALLVIYALVAGPGAYFLLRAKGRGLLLWVVIPGLALAFSALVPIYRLSLRDAESVLVGVRLVEQRAGASEAVETIDVMLFSGSLEPKSVLLPGSDASANTVVPPRRRLLRRGRGGRERAPRPGAALGANDGEQLRFELPVALWGSRYVSLARTWKGRALSGEVALGASLSGAPRVEARLAYDGAVPLLDPVVVYPGRSAPMIAPLKETRLAPGARVEALLETGIPVGSYRAPDRESALAPLVQQRLVAELYGKLAEERKVAFLLASTDEPGPVMAAPNVRTRAFGTVLAIELPLVFEAIVPEAAMRRTERGRTVAAIDSQTVLRERVTRLALPHAPPGGAPGERAAPVDVRLGLTPPVGRRSLGETALAARWYGSGAPEWRELPTSLIQTERGVAGAVRRFVSLPEPAGWLSPEGALEVRQRFTRPRLESDAGHAIGVAASLVWPGGEVAAGLVHPPAPEEADRGDERAAEDEEPEAGEPPSGDD